jgi:hypothetical protein
MSDAIETRSSSQLAPNSSLAVISLIFGIMGFSLLPLAGSIVAVITGILAKNEIQDSGGALSGEGMATAGLVLGWVGLGLSVVIGCCVGALFIVPFCLFPFGMMFQQGGEWWVVPSLLWSMV